MMSHALVAVQATTGAKTVFFTLTRRMTVLPFAERTASLCPSGLNANARTRVVLLVRLPSWTGFVRSATFQRVTALSPPPMASVRPSRLNAIELAFRVFSGRLLSRTGFMRSAISQRITALSTAPMARVRPSELNAVG